MIKHLVLLTSVFILASCASSSSKQHDLDLALGSQVELKDLCTRGRTGACALLGETVVLKKPLPILQSVTTSVQSRLVIAVPSDARLNYFMRAPDGKVSALKSTRLTGPGSFNSALDQVEAFELKARVDYEFFVIGPDGQVWDRRTFRSLDVTRHRARIGLVSEMGSGHTVEQDKMWQSLSRLKPDLLLLLGGNWGGLSVKGESADEIWKQAFQARNSQALYQMNPLVPVLATWNDQEFGKKSGDRTFENKEAAREAFESFFAQKSPTEGFQPGPGVASKMTAFGVSIFLLDNRSFRSPDGVDLNDQSHFGEAQEKWLEDLLREGHEPVLLGSGDQFFGGYHAFSSFEGNQPKDFQKTLGDWKKLKHPLIFMSGNRHLSEILKVPVDKLGYQTFELTSSPMRKIKNKDGVGSTVSLNQIERFSGEMSFVLLELIRHERGFLQFEAEIYGPGQKQEFQRTFTVKSL